MEPDTGTLPGLDWDPGEYLLRMAWDEDLHPRDWQGRWELKARQVEHEAAALREEARVGAALAGAMSGGKVSVSPEHRKALHHLHKASRALRAKDAARARHHLAEVRKHLGRLSKGPGHADSSAVEGALLAALTTAGVSRADVLAVSVALGWDAELARAAVAGHHVPGTRTNWRHGWEPLSFEAAKSHYHNRVPPYWRVPGLQDRPDRRSGKMKHGDWHEGHQAVAPAPVHVLGTDRSRYVTVPGQKHKQLVHGSWSDPWWMTKPGGGWAVSRRWKHSEQTGFDYTRPDRRSFKIPAGDERVLTPVDATGNPLDPEEYSGGADRQFPVLSAAASHAETRAHGSSRIYLTQDSATGHWTVTSNPPMWSDFYAVDGDGNWFRRDASGRYGARTGARPMEGRPTGDLANRLPAAQRPPEPRPAYSREQAKQFAGASRAAVAGHHVPGTMYDWKHEYIPLTHSAAEAKFHHHVPPGWRAGDIRKRHPGAVSGPQGRTPGGHPVSPPAWKATAPTPPHGGGTVGKVKPTPSGSVIDLSAGLGPEPKVPPRESVSSWDLGGMRHSLDQAARHDAWQHARRAGELQKAGAPHQDVMAALGAAESVRGLTEADRAFHAKRLDAYAGAHGLKGWYRHKGGANSTEHMVQVGKIRTPAEGNKGRYYVSNPFPGGGVPARIVDSDTGQFVATVPTRTEGHQIVPDLKAAETKITELESAGEPPKVAEQGRERMQHAIAALRQAIRDREARDADIPTWEQDRKVGKDVPKAMAALDALDAESAKGGDVQALGKATQEALDSLESWGSRLGLDPGVSAAADGLRKAVVEQQADIGMRGFSPKATHVQFDDPSGSGVASYHYLPDPASRRVAAQVGALRGYTQTEHTTHPDLSKVPRSGRQLYEHAVKHGWNASLYEMRDSGGVPGYHVVATNPVGDLKAEQSYPRGKRSTYMAESVKASMQRISANPRPEYMHRPQMAQADAAKGGAAKVPAPAGYQLTRKLPDGTVKTWPRTFKTRRDAAAAVANALVDNGAANRKEAAAFAAKVQDAEPGAAHKHGSGYEFTVTPVEPSGPLTEAGTPARPVETGGEPKAGQSLDVDVAAIAAKVAAVEPRARLSSAIGNVVTGHGQDYGAMVSLVNQMKHGDPAEWERKGKEWAADSTTRGKQAVQLDQIMAIAKGTGAEMPEGLTGNADAYSRGVHEALNQARTWIRVPRDVRPDAEAKARVQAATAQQKAALLSSPLDYTEIIAAWERAHGRKIPAAQGRAWAYRLPSAADMAGVDWYRAGMERKHGPGWEANAEAAKAPLPAPPPAAVPHRPGAPFAHLSDAASKHGLKVTTLGTGPNAEQGVLAETKTGSGVFTPVLKLGRDGRLTTENGHEVQPGEADAYLAAYKRNPGWLDQALLDEIHGHGPGSSQTAAGHVMPTWGYGTPKHAATEGHVAAAIKSNRAGRYDAALAHLAKADATEADAGVPPGAGSRGWIDHQRQLVEQFKAGHENAIGQDKMSARTRAGQIHFREVTGLTIPHPADLKVTALGEYNQAYDALGRGDFTTGLAHLDAALAEEQRLTRKTNAKLAAFRAKVAKAAENPKTVLPALAPLGVQRRADTRVVLDQQGREFTVHLDRDTMQVTVTHNGQTATAPAKDTADATPVARRLAGELTGMDVTKAVAATYYPEGPRPGERWAVPPSAADKLRISHGTDLNNLKLALGRGDLAEAEAILGRIEEGYRYTAEHAPDAAVYAGIFERIGALQGRVRKALDRQRRARLSMTPAERKAQLESLTGHPAEQATPAASRTAPGLSRTPEGEDITPSPQAVYGPHSATRGVTWDPAEHPRVPSGERGGEFARKTSPGGGTVSGMSGSMTAKRPMPVTEIGPLYHGTTETRAQRILAGGFTEGDTDRQGAIYMTPHPDLAQSYAEARVKADKGGTPVVLKIGRVRGVSATETAYGSPRLNREAGAHYMDQGPEVLVLDPSAIHGVTRHGPGRTEAPAIPADKWRFRKVPMAGGGTREYVHARDGGQYLGHVTKTGSGWAAYAASDPGGRHRPLGTFRTKREAAGELVIEAA